MSDSQPPAALLSEIQALNAEADRKLLISPLDAAQLAGQAAELAQTLGAGGRQELALGLTLQGHALSLVGEYSRSKPLLKRAVRLARSLGPSPLLVRAINGLAFTLVFMGEYGRALEYYLTGLKLVRELGDDLGKVRLLNNIGNLYVSLREPQEAFRYHRDALRSVQNVDHPGLSTSVAINTAYDYQELGRYQQALELNLETLRRVQHHGFEQHRALLLANLSDNLRALGRYPEALAYSDEALEISEALHEKQNLCDLLIVRGNILRELGELEEGAQMLRRGLALAQELGAKRYISEAHWQMSLILEAQGRYQEALDHLRQREANERQMTTETVHRKTQVAAAQLKVERAEQRAADERRRNRELSAANAALHAAQQRLHYQATHDLLTGLLNRAAFESELQEALAEGEGLGVLFIDLDHFKQVNDTLGHIIGDALLREVACRFTGELGPNDLLARQGGDEFIVMRRHVHQSRDVASLAEALRHVLDQPVVLGEHAIRVTASIGFALAPEDGQDVVTLQKNADIAMYQAKAQRNSVSRFHAAAPAKADGETGNQGS